MLGRLQGKIALVTGGASGIGRATVVAFAREGAQVIAADIDAEGGDETVRRVEQQGGKACFRRTDVSRADEVAALVEGCVRDFGRLDCAFNNAGIAGVQAAFADYPEDEWDRVLRINLKAIWLCMKHEIRQMAIRRAGAIVNTASAMAFVGRANACAYAAASSGIAGLTKSAALECAASGVRVNAVCPGTIRTPLIERLIAQAPEGDRAKIEAQMAARSPIGRMGAPEEIAESVLWLCSDASSFVTGILLPVDGGFVAG